MKNKTNFILFNTGDRKKQIAIEKIIFNLKAWIQIIIHSNTILQLRVYTSGLQFSCDLVFLYIKSRHAHM